MNLKVRISLCLFATMLLSAAFTYSVVRWIEHGFPAGILLVLNLLLLVALSVLFVVTVRVLNGTIMMADAEREHMQQEHQLLEEQLIHSQKMEAMGQLVSSVAHDFNNILTVIDGYSCLIMADPRAEDVAKNAEEVVQAARKAAYMTRKLLSFSHKERANPVVVDVHTVLCDNYKMLQRLVGEKVTLQSALEQGPMRVKVDPIQLGQVLMNLVINARDAMPNGGTIVFGTAREMIKKEDPRITGRECGGYAVITVQDTGTGIDSDVLKRIFEPFFTTKMQGKGSGLGLSIVQGIVQQNGGFLDVMSKVGDGTLFKVYFPEVCEALEASKDELPEPEPVDRKRVVLLAEDDPEMMALLAQILSQHQYEVLTAADGEKARRMMGAQLERLDLLLTDVFMPNVGGIDLATSVHEIFPHAKVLYMTGYSRSQALAEGVLEKDPLFEKPFTSSELLRKVHELLDEA